MLSPNAAEFSPSAGVPQNLSPTKFSMGSPSGSCNLSMSPMAHPPYPVTECACSTCLYYKSVMFCGRETVSPSVENYMMYQPQFFYPMYQPQVQMSMPTEFTAYPSPSQQRTQRGSSPPTNVSPQVLEKQFAQVIGSLAQLACSSQGRSFLQIIIRLQHVDKIDLIFSEILANIETVLLDQHGCHVVRLLIEVLNPRQISILLESLNDTLVLNMCTVSQYTRRILQTLFEKHPQADLLNLVRVLSQNARYLAALQQGCISLMRVYETCTPEFQHMIVKNLLPLLTEVACDPYGNYVVQCILEKSDRSTAVKYIEECFTGKYLRLACNKFASNVMERVLQIAPPMVRQGIVDELIFNPAALQQLVHDGFGNFVVQAIVDSTSSHTEFKKIQDRLKPLLVNSPFGHKIESRLKSKRFTTTTCRGLKPMEVNVNHLAPIDAC